MVSKDRTAQVMLEYLAMAMIILFAIIVGGPVLINSIGAHFRIAEDNVTDAFSEKPKQAVAQVCACNPTSSNPMVWPAIGECGEEGCSALATMRERLCPGCAVTEEHACVESKDCCYDPVKVECGTLNPSAEAILCPVREGMDATSNEVFAGGAGRCLNPSGGVSGCLSGEALYRASCGQSFIRFACLPDSTCVLPCTSTIWTPNPNTVCEGQEFTQTGDCPGDTQIAQGTMAPVCPPASSVMCGEEITPTNGCGTCPGTGTAGQNCPVGYECKDGDCQRKCWSNIIQPVDTGLVREGDGRGQTDCDSTIERDDPPCGPFPGCPYQCNNGYKQIESVNNDSCYTRTWAGTKKWHKRKRWICADTEYQTKCYRDRCASSIYSLTQDGWVNENGRCVK